MNIKRLNKYLLDSNRRVCGFCFEIAGTMFHVFKEEHNFWCIRSHKDINIPSLVFEVRQSNPPLELVANTAIYALRHYLIERWEFESKLVSEIDKELSVPSGATGSR